MPSFIDGWLIDRVLFDYVAGGSCACCGLSHFLPNGTADLITAVSDIETDQANAEIEGLEHDPWPANLRDQVWGDRVKLRQAMKRDMPTYNEFWESHGASFVEWCRSQDESFWKRSLQLPRSEILETVNSKYDIHSAYGVVLGAILEQVAHFQKTEYDPDGKDRVELDFERCLSFSRMGGFTLPPTSVDVLIERIRYLRGPKLLERKAKQGPEDEDSDDDDADGGRPTKTKSSGGFSSDRRIVRLLIARHWADLLMKKFMTTRHES